MMDGTAEQQTKSKVPAVHKLLPILPVGPPARECARRLVHAIGSGRPITVYFARKKVGFVAAQSGCKRGNSSDMLYIQLNDMKGLKH